jgi:hypothetical protein
MKKAVKVAGWMADPRHIELDEPLTGVVGKVEIIVRSTGEPQPVAGDILDLVSALPAGSRTKEDIDRQMQEERSSWGAP